MKRPPILSEIVAVVILIAASVAGCNSSSQPRPRGYFRIDMPEKSYVAYDSTCPFTFEYPSYGVIAPSDEIEPQPCWFNIEFPSYKAKLHISYREVGNEFNSLLEDAYTLAYKHSVKADAISEIPFENVEERVFGLLYDLKGNTATAVQFYLTDSLKHFIRGSLYFYASPNADSLAPVIDFFRDDIIHIMETTRWNDNKQTARQ
ncbi:MAG: gliding motility lipoprotein GldD [Bacteroidales bacterium]|nr:gliding motility lipoprotein GldD [Bacteroidales bacterium]